MSRSKSKWGRFVLNTPNKIIVQFERVEAERKLESGLVLPQVWTKNVGEGRVENVVFERDSITDIARVLAVGRSYYDANGNLVEQPCAVGDRVWSNGAWGRPVPHPDHLEKPDPTIKLITFTDVLAIVEDGDD